jgi:tetratricopeptide (TPR) repeat protein
MSILCPDQELTAVLAALQDDTPKAVDRLELALQSFPEDHRLLFLKGSLMIEAGRHIEAHQILTQAVRIAPDYAVARFQLGFFQLTSGEVDQALDTWGRLDRLPNGHCLRCFVDGLRCLIRDDYQGAVDHLRIGVAQNVEFPPLNGDMTLIINRCLDILRSIETGGEPGSGSETEFLLRQVGMRPTKH